MYHCVTVNDIMKKNYFLLDYLWLHIRAVGEWTNSLYSYFEKEQIKLHRSDILPVEDCNVTNAPRKKS